jgi:hypothetical protein
MHAVSVEVECGDIAESLRLAERIAPRPELSIERRVAFQIDQAVGYSRQRDYAAALVMLQAVASEAPEDIAYRPAARCVLGAVVHHARAGVARQAAGLAQRVGVAV